MTSAQVASSREDLLAPHQSISSAQGESSFSHKYLSPEFAGFAGEWLLKSILHKILPMALYCTWEIFADHQVPGNECFLSIERVAEISERAERTIHLDLHELQARKLLVLRGEQKGLRQADGSHKRKLVVVKDFAGLYALAHEYALWRQSEGSLEPEHDFVEVIQQDERLFLKLLRFHKDRCLILKKVPGPQTQLREEHLWYTTSDAQTDGQEQTSLDASTQESFSPDAEEAQIDKNGVLGKLSLQKQLQEDAQKASQARVIPRTSTDQRERFVRFESPSKGKGSGRPCIVYLHAAHQYQDIENQTPQLLALCPRCHMKHDREQANENRRSGYGKIISTENLARSVRPPDVGGK